MTDVPETAEQHASTEPAARAKAKQPRWRRALVAVLVVIGCVLAPLSIVGVWLKSTLLDTDQYVSTVGPLIDDADVQQALANRITDALLQGTGVQDRITDALPAQASFVAPAIASGLDSFVNQAALRAVQSDAFEKLWDTVNERAHRQVVALLEGKERVKGAVTTNNGQVVVKLGPLVAAVQQQLEDRGIDIFSGSAASKVKREIVLIDSKDLKQVQGLTDLLQKLGYILPFITLLLFAAAIALSGNRRRTILRSALGIALAMALLLVLFNSGRHFYLDALPSTVSRPAAAAVYDQVLSFLRLSLRTAFAIALVIALGAWLAGPGKAATRIRSTTLALVRGHDTGEEPSGVAVWVARYKTPLRIVVLAIGFAILVITSAPTPLEVLIIAIVVVLALLLVEFLGRSVRPAGGADA
jgi:hypothetical protein